MPSRAEGKATSRPKKKTTKKKVAKKAAATKATATKKKTTKRKAAVKEPTEPAARSLGKLHVRQVRSGIGSSRVLRRTLTALGLKHHQDEVVVPDNPSIRGMLRKVHHLVSVRPEGENV